MGKTILQLDSNVMLTIQSIYVSMDLSLLYKIRVDYVFRIIIFQHVQLQTVTEYESEFGTLPLKKVIALKNNKDK